MKTFIWLPGYLVTWRFLTATLKCICYESFTEGCWCIVVVRWTGQLPIELPYANSLPYLSKPIVTTVSSAFLQPLATTLFLQCIYWNQMTLAWALKQLNQVKLSTYITEGDSNQFNKKPEYLLPLKIEVHLKHKINYTVLKSVARTIASTLCNSIAWHWLLALSWRLHSCVESNKVERSQIFTSWLQSRCM